MHETDIRKLFMRALEYPGQNTDATRQVFSVLVRSTLKYRDDMLASEDIVVTVEDVRVCLGWLVPALATGNMPDTENKVSLGLLKLWLEDLQNASILRARPK